MEMASPEKRNIMPTLEKEELVQATKSTVKLVDACIKFGRLENEDIRAIKSMFELINARITLALEKQSVVPTSEKESNVPAIKLVTAKSFGDANELISLMYEKAGIITKYRKVENEYLPTIVGTLTDKQKEWLKNDARFRIIE